MRRANSLRWSGVLGLCVGLWTLGAGAQQPAADASGVYSKEGSELAVLQGDNETLVYYEGTFPQGQSVGTCECSFVVGRKQPSRWTLKNPDSEAPWTLRLEAQQLVLESQGTPGCCGAGFSGVDTFTRASTQPPLACKVKAPRVYFQGSDAGNPKRKAFVVAGDAVEVYVPGEEPSLVPARFLGKKSVVGLLPREQLDCGARGSTASAPPPALDVKSMAGSWLNVRRKGKGYVIEQPCGASTPRFTVAPSGDMELEYGQEGERVKVTTATPAAKGAYTLVLAREGGSTETLAWTVVDAKKEIVRLKGGSGFFQRGELFVRESRKGGIPVQAETCDEFE